MMRRTAAKHAGIIAAAVLAATLTSCGYHVGGQADTIPKGIQTIAIKPFKNLTTEYRLTDSLPQAITRELIARSHYQVVNDPKDADAILDGAITRMNSYPEVFDPTTGKATSVEVSVFLQLSLRQRSTGKVLYSQPNFEARNTYEISVDPHQYFNESDAAVGRLSRDVARTVVSGILENF